MNDELVDALDALPDHGSAVVEALEARQAERYRAEVSRVEKRLEEAYAGRGAFADDELRYAATKRCPCGAGLAYPTGIGMHGSWDCSDILTGRAAHSGSPEAKTHTGRLPFAFYEIKSEDQPSADGRTTRPGAGK